MMGIVFISKSFFDVLRYFILTGVCLLFFHFSQAQTTVNFSSPGSQTFTVPPGVTSVDISCWGGGGRGGNRSTNGSSGGGGSGAYVQTLSFGVSPFQILNLNIGNGASTAGTSPPPGGDSWISNTGIAPVSAAQGVLAKGGSSVANDQAAGAAGGASAACIGGIITGGNSGSNGASNGGNGGSAPSGGAGGNGASTQAAGIAGSAPGGGGGGAKRTSSGTFAGGNGGAGRISITYNFPCVNQVSVTGGSSASYCTLREAFNAINAGTHSGNITIAISADTWETQSCQLQASNGIAPNYSSIIIFPTLAGVNIRGDVAGPMIELNGADQVIFDGRLNGSGNPHELTIANYNTGSAAVTNNSTIRMVNSACDNQIRYCRINGSSTNGTITTANLGGVITVHTATGGTGNDNNIISFNKISNAGGNRPNFLVSCVGSGGAQTNDNLQVLNNELFDHARNFNGTTAALIGPGSNGVQVSNNSIYETTPVVLNSGITISPISIVNSSGHTISGNFIGGAAPQCGGAAYSLSTATALTFSLRAIWASYNTAPTTVLNIVNNTIANFSVVNSSNVNPFYAIFCGGTVTGGILQVNNNTIGGSNPGNINIVSSNSTAASSFGISMLAASGNGNLVVNNNQISGISISGNVSDAAHRFTAIQCIQSGSVPGGTHTISGNTIGSLSITNSIQAIQTGPGIAANTQYIYGIESQPGQNQTATIENNFIGGISQTAVNTQGATGIAGIQVSGAGNAKIINNNIRGLTSDDQNNSGAEGDGSVFGIRMINSAINSLGTPFNEITGNTISLLHNPNTGTATVRLFGIYNSNIQKASTNAIKNNFIHSISAAGSSSAIRIIGLQIFNGTIAGDGALVVRNVFNNIIGLGASLNNDYEITAIRESGSTARTLNIFFNTVEISGNVASAAAFSRVLHLTASSASNVRSVRNNIFRNARSGNASGAKHYVIFLANTNGLTLDYNVYHAPGAGGTVGFDGSTDVNVLPVVSGQDASSLIQNPQFITSGSSNPVDYKCTIAFPMLHLPSFTLDFSGSTRDNPPQAGAWHFRPLFQWTGVVSSAWNTPGNWIPAGPPITNSDVLIPSSGVTNNPTVSSLLSPVFNAFTIQSGRVLTIMPNASLKTQGLLDHSGEIIIESGGALVQTNTSGLSGNGNFKIRRSLSAGTYYIGSPILNQTVSGFGIMPTGPDGAQIIPDLTNPCNPTQVDVTSPFGNLLELRENPGSVLSNCAQSLWHIKSAGTLETGRGYSVTSGVALALEFEGTVHNGPVTFTGLGRQSGSIDQYNGVQTRGWHLVSNPYPSPIRLTNGSLGPDFDNAVYLLDHGNFIPVPLNLGDAVIATGQGFQIRKTNIGGSADFVLDNTFREEGNPIFYSTSNTPDAFLNVLLQQGNQNSSVMIYFEDDADDDFDAQYDANCLQGRPDVSLLYSLSGNQERLAFDARTSLSILPQQSITLGVYDANPGNYVLHFNQILLTGVVIQLEDLKTGQVQVIQQGDSYPFVTQAGDLQERFVLHFLYQNPLGNGQAFAGEWRIYPNPSKDLIELSGAEGMSWEIRDLTGRLVLSGKNPADGKTNRIDIGRLAAGTYGLRICEAGGSGALFIKTGNNE